MQAFDSVPNDGLVIHCDILRIVHASLKVQCRIFDCRHPHILVLWEQGAVQFISIPKASMHPCDIYSSLRGFTFWYLIG